MTDSTNHSAAGSTRGLVAELTLVVLLVGYGSFSVHRLVLLLLLGSQSLWLRGLGWRDVCLRRPADLRRALLQGIVAAAAILVAVRFVIVPAAAWLARAPVDLSALDEPGDARAFARWLLQAYTLAAFGEEMVFRGYLFRRLLDLVGESVAGCTLAVAIGSALFGLAHGYQGWAGVMATGTIGAMLSVLYIAAGRNLWPVIACHALVDAAALSAIYFDRRSWLFP